MLELNQLEKALSKFHDANDEFPIGAICLNDLMPTEDDIVITKELLKQLSTRILVLRARKKALFSSDKHEEDPEDMQDMVHKVTAPFIINARAVRLCLHSHTIQAIISEEEGDADTRRKIYAYMDKLYTLNYKVVSLHKLIEKAYEKQLELNIQCQKSVFDYRKFLKEQEELSNKKLIETNPNIAKTKEEVKKKLLQINIMKKLITNFIAASGHMLQKESRLYKMLEDHRELITIELLNNSSKIPK